MLTLTSDAASSIRGLVDGQFPDGGGLRITSGDTPGSLQLSLAAVPAEDDRVVSTEGASVFLDEQAAEALDNGVLDADLDGQGGVQFALTAQQP